MGEFALAMVILIGTILLGIPISYAMGISGLTYILMTNPSYIVVIPNRLYEGINQFQLLAIPFFLLASDIMVNADISGKLFRLVKLFRALPRRPCLCQCHRQHDIRQHIRHRPRRYRLARTDRDE